MPKTLEEESQVIVIQAPFGGWTHTMSGTSGATANEGALSPKLIAANDQYSQSTGISLFNSDRFGHIAPSNTFTAITDSGTKIDDLPLNGAIDSTSLGWIVLKDGRLVHLGSLGTSTGNAFDPNVSSGTHSGHTPSSTNNADLLVMYDLASTPVEWAVWSWEDATDADISVMKVDESSENDVWGSVIMGAALKKGNPLKLCQGPDGNIYFTNGSTVQQINILAGMAAATKGLTLAIGANWQATGICSYKNYVAIIATTKNTGFTGVTRGACRVYLWDGIQTGFNFSFDIPDNYANAIFFDGITLLALTNGRNNTSKIHQFTGSAFKKVFETALLSVSSTPLQGGLESYRDSLMLAANNSYIYQFYAGGFHNYAVATDANLGIPTSIGMLKNLYQNQLFVGVGISGGFKLYYSADFTHYYTPADFRTILYTAGIMGRRLYPMGFKGTINRIKIYLSQWGTGASIILSLFKDQNSISIQGGNDKLGLLIDTDTATANSATHQAFPSGTTEMDLSGIFAVTDISTFFMNIRFNHAASSNTAAIIRKMEIFITPAQ